MEQETFTFQTDDGYEIFACKWTNGAEEKPRVIVQLAHGMAEHIKRYDHFAQKLVSESIFVYGNDHRGHGETGKRNNRIGYFADVQGFEKVVHDMAVLTSKIELDFPSVPIILFGHSMGSFLSRRYIQLFGERLSGVILSGTGGDPGIMGKIGRMIAAREMKKKGRTTPSPLLNSLTFGNYNKAFHPARTEFDWLSRDENEVDKYIEDPDCGGIFTSGFFYDLLEGLETINKPENISLIPAKLPIWLISGSLDPVGNNTKGVLKTYQAFKKAGIIDVSYQFYENARHELLNEMNKENVEADIIHWIKDRVTT
ncbi:alpha/beta hydrolase [Bacillus sp. BRMEA1]|uniref:alpha/beta hydrolase n=1 Tax=Neobacillus endophyticus TaxID=2738405 RepID=UPI0015636D43|nr:alpha/beta hydrolase [Neobacillus endophyticus]NRD78236.1 alpha/beta hydrolase [Neobacillus endophyticus]